MASVSYSKAHEKETEASTEAACADVPDFIPVLGYVDDLIIVPLGIALVVQMIPDVVLVDCRARAQAASERPTNRKAAAIIVAIWGAAAALLIWLAYRAFT